MSEICIVCGQSVEFGSGRYVNRVPDLNTEEDRRDMGMPYPEGNYRCIDCEEKYLREHGKLCQVCEHLELNVDSWEGFEAICLDCETEMKKTIENLPDKQWPCWTLSTEDIVAIAKRKGIPLSNKNLDDIARLVKKGIEAGIEDVWEQIIEEAIWNA